MTKRSKGERGPSKKFPVTRGDYVQTVDKKYGGWQLDTVTEMYKTGFGVYGRISTYRFEDEGVTWKKSEGELTQ